MDGLPSWLANPVLLAPESSTASVTLDADEERLLAPVFSALNIDGLFPVQHEVWRRLADADGGDLCVSAPTGAGKTLAYVLPVVARLRDRVVRRLRALIVVPTRDLVRQVEGVMGGVSEALAGGRTLQAGQDYLVMTPGRLVDMLPSLSLAALQFLVIDEADRLLDQSFQDWLMLLLGRVAADRAVSAVSDEGGLMDSAAWTHPVRMLLFSATLGRNPAHLAPLRLYRPTLLLLQSVAESGPGQLTVPERLCEAAIVVQDSALRPAVLLDLLVRLLPVFFAQESDVAGEMLVDVDATSPPPIIPTRLHSILCFVQSVTGGERLAQVLRTVQPGLAVASFHGGLTDAAREGLLAAFASRQVQVLVGSDALARGIDLPDVRVVINYDCPRFAGTYVHRVGRTARAGRGGTAITLLAKEQVRRFREIVTETLNREFWARGQMGVQDDGFLADDALCGLEAGRVVKLEASDSWLMERYESVLQDALRQL